MYIRLSVSFNGILMSRNGKLDPIRKYFLKIIIENQFDALLYKSSLKKNIYNVIILTDCCRGCLYKYHH